MKIHVELTPEDLPRLLGTGIEEATGWLRAKLITGAFELKVDEAAAYTAELER